MDKPVQHSRFKLFMIGAVLVLALGNGFTLSLVWHNAHKRCVETSKRAAATAPALRKVEAASRADGDKHMADVWKEYLDAAQKNPIPKC